jgi:SAM-dependent methyltransferase
MHLNSELIFSKYGLSCFRSGLKVLEIAPASFPSRYQELAGDPSMKWETIDFVSTEYIDQAAVKNLTYELKSPYSFPLEDESYDIVLSGQVLEHVEKIWVWLKELKRVVKKGGLIITINPVSWIYHEAPIDCWRVYPSGIKALAEEAGLVVEFARFESVELEQLKQQDPGVYTIPGRSYAYCYSPKKLAVISKWNKFIRKVPKAGFFLPIPIEVAYDTISVLKRVD